MHDRQQDRQAGEGQELTCRIVCKPRIGLLKASTSAPAPFSKSRREIVKQQDAFLTHGVQFLRPLNLKTVADAIEMHESTVSRVTSNKYMATSQRQF